MGTAGGKLAGLMTDHACDKPQKSKTQYSIPSEFRETRLVVVWRPCKGCVPGDISLDSECDYIFAGAATTVLIFSNYLLHTSQGCKVWLGPGSINHFSWKAATQVRVLQQHFLVSSLWFMELGYLVICRFLLVRMGLKFHSLSYSLHAIPSYLQRLILLQMKPLCKLFLQNVL